MTSCATPRIWSAALQRVLGESDGIGCTTPSSTGVPEYAQEDAQWLGAYDVQERLQARTRRARTRLEIRAARALRCRRHKRVRRLLGRRCSRICQDGRCRNCAIVQSHGTVLATTKCGERKAVGSSYEQGVSAITCSLHVL